MNLSPAPTNGESNTGSQRLSQTVVSNSSSHNVCHRIPCPFGNQRRVKKRRWNKALFNPVYF